MKLEQKIEAILFWKSEPLEIKQLARMIGSTEAEISQAILSLESQLENRGVALIRKDNEVMLGTAKETAALIEKLTKDELSSDLGRAGLETLSVIIYKGPISRREIDFIRGVNSTFILRHLMIRGLVERIIKPKDERSFLYRPTFELMAMFGITKLNEMPKYQEIVNQLIKPVEREDE